MHRTNADEHRAPQRAMAIDDNEKIWLLSWTGNAESGCLMVLDDNYALFLSHEAAEAQLFRRLSFDDSTTLLSFTSSVLRAFR